MGSLSPAGPLFLATRFTTFQIYFETDLDPLDKSLSGRAMIAWYLNKQRNENENRNPCVSTNRLKTDWIFLISSPWVEYPTVSYIFNITKLSLNAKHTYNPFLIKKKSSNYRRVIIVIKIRCSGQGNLLRCSRPSLPPWWHDWLTLYLHRIHEKKEVSTNFCWSVNWCKLL